MQHPTADADMPQNELEKAIQSARTGTIPVDDMLRRLLHSDLYVPSATEMRTDGWGLTPLFFNKMGLSMLVVFSSLERAKQYADKAPYCLKMDGRELIKRMPTEYGMVVNPGNTLSFDILAEGLKSAVTRNTH